MKYTTKKHTKNFALIKSWELVGCFVLQARCFNFHGCCTVHITSVNIHKTGASIHSRRPLDVPAGYPIGHNPCLPCHNLLLGPM